MTEWSDKITNISFGMLSGHIVWHYIMVNMRNRVEQSTSGEFLQPHSDAPCSR